VTIELGNDIEAIRRALCTGQKSRAKANAQEALARIAKLVAAVDTLNEWIVQPSERGIRRGLMYRVWDTGRGQVVCDLSNDQDPHPCAKFQGDNATVVIIAAATALHEGTVLP
jgi:hypothetical protein